MKKTDSKNIENVVSPPKVSVLVVDDDPAALHFMTKVLEREGYRCIGAPDAASAISILAQQEAHVAVIDILLPDMSGLELHEAIKHKYPTVQTILVTGHPDITTVTRAMRQGTLDYLVKPFEPEQLIAAVARATHVYEVERENAEYRKRLETLVEKRTLQAIETERRLLTLVSLIEDGIVVVGKSGKLLFWNKAAQEVVGLPEVLAFFQQGRSEDLTIKGPDGKERVFEAKCSPIVWEGEEAYLFLLRDVTEQRKTALEHVKMVRRYGRMLEETTMVLASAVELRDPFTSGHQARVARLACAIYDDLGLPAEAREGLRIAGSLHDVGKLQVPIELLVKPGRLTPAEFEVIKTHCEAGYQLLRKVDFPWPVAKIVLQHHERMDGSGYPHGLKGDEILIEARILAVADVVEAMTAHRPYREALGLEMALEEIEAKKGIYYDEDVVLSCLRLFREKGFRLTR